MRTGEDRETSVPQIMGMILLTALPGSALLSWFFGYGILINILLAIASSLAFEALMLRLRQKPVLDALKDLSAVVTGLLIALCLPPTISLWLIVIATFFAIVIAKHLYGGLGNNVFNPAMVGYAVLLVSFPLAMSTWISVDTDKMDLFEVILVKTNREDLPDGMTMPTPLDRLKFREEQTISQLWDEENGFGHVAGRGFEWINLCFLLGGLVLIYRRVITWHAPFAMLMTLTLLAFIFYDQGSSNSLGSPLFHLFSGGTMLCAFFVITDPVTNPATMRGQLIFGAVAAVIIFFIRALGAYPDGIAFAVILMNAATPLIDHYVKNPRLHDAAKKELPA